MSSEEWTGRVVDAALDIARAAPDSKFTGTPAGWVGRILLLMGRAAGHTDQMAGRGPNAAVARRHFRDETREAAALALALLQESWRRQQRPARSNEEVTGEIARQKVLAAKALDQHQYSPIARHATAGLGAAIVALATAIPTVPLDDVHLPELDRTLENVVAHAIVAVALSEDATP
jgi:hypothetical protein